MELRGETSNLAARGVAMQFAFTGSLVERGDSGAQFFLRRGGIGRGDRFGCDFDGGADLRTGCAVVFATLEVLPLALLC